MKSKIITSPPLPFNGSKRYWINTLKEQFKDYKLEPDVLIVDLFGGSGILSHLFAWMFPNNKVIYNDFDHYLDLFKEVDKINTMTEWGRQFLQEKGYRKNDKITMEDKDIILKQLNEIFGEKYEENNKLFNVICANWCFSGRNNLNGFLYNKMTAKPYRAIVEEYILPNITVINQDYKEIMKQLKDYDPSKLLFILDPPYLSTSKSFYNEYWGIEETCNIIDICLKYKSILFESDKSEILPLIELLKRYSKLDIKMKISKEKCLSGRSKSNDYYVLFNFDELEMFNWETKPQKEKITLTKEELELIKKMREDKKEMTNT